MTAQDDLKLQLMIAIRDWVRTERLSQREAARRLGIAQPVVSHLVNGRCRYSAGWLLDAWVASGGTCQVQLGRGNGPVKVIPQAIPHV